LTKLRKTSPGWRRETKRLQKAGKTGAYPGCRAAKPCLAQRTVRRRRNAGASCAVRDRATARRVTSGSACACRRDQHARTEEHTQPASLSAIRPTAQSSDIVKRNPGLFQRLRRPGILALRGKPLLRASQPGELCVQQGDGVGRGLLRRGAERGGLGWRRHYGDAGASGALVSPEGSAAPRPDEAQLQRGLIKQDIGVVGHKCLPDTTFALLTNTSKSKVLTNQLLTFKK